MRARSIRRLAGVTTTAVLLGSTMLATAGGVQAAPPRWVMDVTALPGAVPSGATAGYTVTITNTGPSNISQLYLVTKTTAATTYVDDSGDGRDACTPEGVALRCVFGALNALDHVTITVAYTASGSGSFDPGFEGNTSGSTYTDPKRSHGDTLVDLDFAGTTLNNDKNFGGKFNIADGGSVGNNGTLTGQNKQATKVLNIPAATPATVLDGSTATGSCTSDASLGIDCTKLFGEWSEVTVGDGGPYAEYIVIQISFKSGTPSGFLHSYANGQEKASGCADNVAPTSTSQLPCFTWDGHTTASIYTLNNGSWRGL